VFTVRSLGGGFASIDVPVEELADLGRRLLARAAAFA
jgi:uridine phosphorylase